MMRVFQDLTILNVIKFLTIEKSSSVKWGGVSSLMAAIFNAKITKMVLDNDIILNTKTWMISDYNCWL